MRSPDETPDFLALATSSGEPATSPELMPPHVSWPPQASSRRPLDATKAALIFLAYLGSQFLAGALIATLIAAVGGALGLFDPSDSAAVQAAVSRALPWLLLFTMAVSALVLLGLSRLLAAPELPLRDAVGAAWVAGLGRHVALGLAAGMVTALVSLYVTVVVFPAPDDLPMGPVARLATGSPFEQATWVILALVLAPPIEELLFRGVMLGGFARSFGVVFSSSLVTLIFVSMHLPEAVFYPPALIGITLLALCTLWARLASGAVGPAIAVHVAYNGVVVLTAVLALS